MRAQSKSVLPPSLRRATRSTMLALGLVVFLGACAAPASDEVTDAAPGVEEASGQENDAAVDTEEGRAVESLGSIESAPDVAPRSGAPGAAEVEGALDGDVSAPEEDGGDPRADESEEADAPGPPGEDGGDAPPADGAGAALAAATSEAARDAASGEAQDAASDIARDASPGGAPSLGMPAETHPLQIDWLRQRDFPGSDLVIEQELAPGSNYDRYIASYLSDGLKIYALLTIPQGERPESGWPVVVFNHGYIPPEQYRTTERYIAYTDAFSRNGYMLLRSDYRGHGSSEGEAEGGYGSPDYTVDVLNALASVRRHPDADPERIGMWGHSMGGHITLRSMVTDPGIKAGVIWAGVVAPTERRMERWAARATERAAAGEAPSGWERRGRWRNDLVERFGTPEQNPDFWASLSANSYLDELSGPIQLHHGTADSSVPYDYSETLQRDLEAIGWPSELYTYPGDDHNISANLGTALQRSVDFFDAHVKGG